MSIFDERSKRYLIISGEHKGCVCVVFEAFNGYVDVFFIDNNKAVTVKYDQLVEIETPGWERNVMCCPYGIGEHFQIYKNNGTNMLRTKNLCQPYALKKDDILVTGESVVENPRHGYNSSALIRLNIIGWVEIAPRLPIALIGNNNFKLPAELAKNDRLATGCLIVRDPISQKINWTDIFLDYKECRISVPSCIPLALVGKI